MDGRLGRIGFVLTNHFLRARAAPNALPDLPIEALVCRSTAACCPPSARTLDRATRRFPILGGAALLALQCAARDPARGTITRRAVDRAGGYANGSRGGAAPARPLIGTSLCDWRKPS